MYPINLSSLPHRKANTRFPWVVIRSYGELLAIVPARFASRGQAEEHAKLLRRMTPTDHFEVAFKLYDQL